MDENCATLNTREEAERFLARHFERASSGKSWHLRGTYILKHGEYAAPGYFVRKVRGDATLSSQGGFYSDDIAGARRKIARLYNDKGYQWVTDGDIVILNIIPLPIR